MATAPTMNGPGQAGPGQHSVAFEYWEKFLFRCTQRRLDQDKFEEYVSIMYTKAYLRPEAIAYLFLRPTPNFHHSLDPRILLYLQVLQEKGYIHTPALLRAMYTFSTSRTKAESHKLVDGGGSGGSHGNHGNHLDQNRKRKKGVKKHPQRWINSYIAEEPIFYSLVKRIAQNKTLSNSREAISVVAIISQWMNLFTNAASAFAADEVMGTSTEANSNLRMEMEGARVAFMGLVLGVIENPLVIQFLRNPGAKSIRKMLSEAMSVFVPGVIQGGAQPGMVERLDMFCTNILVAMDPDLKDKKEKEDEMENMMDPSMALDTFHLPDLHIPNTRAALYVYLNAAASLIGRPAVNDQDLYSYLHNRYHGDIQNTTIDLILASFDVLANAVFRNDNPKMAHVLRSYLINKVPLLVKTLSHSLFPPFTTEHCIREALRQVDQNAFPTLSTMFDDTNSNNTFTDSVRQDFCFACALHHLIPVSSIEGLLGDMTYQTLPSSGRYEKDTLVQKCRADPERIQALVSELDNMDGNVGAVCEALVEVMKWLCQNKETLPLKSLATMLAKKPLSLDVLLLFENPVTILRPLCDLLDEWRYEDDQGEYGPVYEEFGAVLLLLLSFVHRYSLSAADLGLVQVPNSFVFKLLNKGYLSHTLDEVSEEDRTHLGNWVIGFFDPDSGGLSNELMSSCPPQTFYLLVPTLVNQIVLARSSGALTEEALKSGVEYLLDAFLLPSLVTALTWLGTHLWVDRPAEQQSVIRMLQLILTPKSIPSEATSLLNAVVTTVARPLDHSLRTYQRRDPKSQDVEPLLRSLRDSLAISRRVVSASHNELESWAATQSGGLAAALRTTVVGLVTWALAPDLNVMPTPYTHRQLLAALRLLGAKKTLRTMIDEIVQVVNAVAGNNNSGSSNNNGGGNTNASTSGNNNNNNNANSTNIMAANTVAPPVPPPPVETVGVVYDVVAGLICAPDVSETSATSAPPQYRSGEQKQQQQKQQQISSSSTTNSPQPQPQPQRRIGLREALHHAAEEAATAKSRRIEPPGYGEVAIRLYRRVEALLAPTTITVPDEVVAAATAAAAAAGVGAETGLSVEEVVSMDMGGDVGMDGIGTGIGSGSAGGGGGGGLGVMDLHSVGMGMGMGGLDVTSGFGELGEMDLVPGDELLLTDMDDGSGDMYGWGDMDLS